MKIRHYTIIIIYFLLSVERGEAQKKDSLSHALSAKNEVSFDMFYYLNIFRYHFFLPSSSQMNFAIEHHFSHENLIRFGSAVVMQKNETRHPSQPVLHHTKSLYLLHLGIEKERDIYNRWVFFFGFDILYKYEIQKNEQGNSTIGITSDLTKSLSYGVAQVMGIKYELNDRISISTESDFEFWFYRSKVTSNNEFSPSNNHSNKAKGRMTKVPFFIKLPF